MPERPSQSSSHKIRNLSFGNSTSTARLYGFDPDCPHPALFYSPRTAIQDDLDKIREGFSRKKASIELLRPNPGKMAAPHQPQLVFVDGSFDELAQEMADFLNVGDDVKVLIEKQQKDDILKKLIIASPALHSIPEKEFAGAYNLLVYLILQSDKAEMFLPRVCDNLTKPITSSPMNGPGLALNTLTTIFNMLKPDDGLRFNVFMAILRFLKFHGMFENLKSYLKSLDDWMDEWEIDSEDQRQAYEAIAEAAREVGDVS